jgi:hypothetical protein
VYFWRIQRLKRDLAAGLVSEAAALPYLLVPGALTTFLISAPLIHEAGSWDVVEALASAGLYVLGALYAFRRNGGAAGASFFVRYLSLTWVVGIRIGLAVGVPLLGVLVLLEEAWLGSTSGMEVIYTFASLALEVAMYVRIAQHVGEVASAPPAG